MAIYCPKTPLSYSLVMTTTSLECCKAARIWFGHRQSVRSWKAALVTHPPPALKPSPSLNLPTRIAAAELNQLRENWRNPIDMFGNPALNADQLRRRTLTNLYNEYPTWLAHAHATLDAAVADAYGWPADLADGEVLERLLALNLERTAIEQAGE